MIPTQKMLLKRRARNDWKEKRNGIPSHIGIGGSGGLRLQGRSSFLSQQFFGLFRSLRRLI